MLERMFEFAPTMTVIYGLNDEGKRHSTVATGSSYAEKKVAAAARPRKKSDDGIASFGLYGLGKT